MVWRETFPPANQLALDAELERERRLAAQARAGADWALTALIARYQPTVTRYLTRLCGDQSRARALAERVFQRMERRLHGPHGGENLRLWLLRSSTEAGLEALRRPQRAQPPRLGAASPVAGLLPQESGDGPPGPLRGGMSRLRNVVGAVSRQARPLVWQGERAAAMASEGKGEPDPAAPPPGPVDETFDSIDPREALRHRLIRLTLADLPYGDAQCLALHLVAGLNQAEVARALGITSSAARKRIVQGLAQFSERYQAAVLSLGLPDDLGYGSALPRPIEETAPAAEPEPEPVIVPETAEEMVAMEADMGEPAPTTVPLTVDSLDDRGAPVSGVSYFASEAIEARAAAEHLALEGFSQEQSGFDAVASGLELPDIAATGATGEETPLLVAIRHTPVLEPGDDDMEPGSVNDSEGSATLEGSVTRIAADAIVGPVVDALPIHSEPLAMAPGLGSPGPHSTPLAYELASGSEADSNGITMNWIDSTGMMAPLSFEAIATPATAASPEDERESRDPWEMSTILQFEEPGAARELPDNAPPDEAHIFLDAGGDPAISPTTPVDFSIALDEGSYRWARAREETALPQTTYYAPDEAQSAERARPDATPAPPIARTLEDIWDEASDTYGG